MTQLIHEEALDTFEGFSHSQAVDMAVLAEQELPEWRSI